MGIPMEKIINPVEVMQQRLAVSMGLDKYKVIMESIRKTDVSKDVAFQRRFNGFYGIRRDAEWRASYYGVFERKKASQTTYKDIIEEIYQIKGSVEASFSSKMYATLYPEKPIWDKYVLRNLGLVMPTTVKDRLNIAIEIYNKIEQWYADFLVTENAQECLEVFDKMLPEYSWVSNIKKIDFYLWSIR